MNETMNLNLSSSPHVRSRLNTTNVMLQVIISLIPVTVVGVINFGLSSLITICASIVTAVVCEWLFDKITKRKNTVNDLSAVVTGLLLALCLPAGVPLYIPILGAAFSILVVKCFFGGLGKNFMNPALAGRCFLLISFSNTVTAYKFDGVTSATPLAQMAAGEHVSLMKTFLGLTNGVLGDSILAMLIGGIFLLAIHAITIEIPAAVLISFTCFMALFGGHGFDPYFLGMSICGGGIVMAAIFMATDPVTSPMSTAGKVLYGVLIGVIAGIFRVFATAADSVSYSVVIANLAVPLIDMYIVPKPFAYRKNAKKAIEGGSSEKKAKGGFPTPAIALLAITLIAGLLLSAVYTNTKANIARQEYEAKMEAYQEVMPGAVKVDLDKAMNKKISKISDKVYGTKWGNVYINEMADGTDKSGKVTQYAISVTSADGYAGNITLTVGFKADGTINGIHFTELNETAGMGMRCNEPEFRDQFNGRKVDTFTLNKSGSASSDSEINSVSGASISSGAVVNAVDAAIDFFNNNVVKGGN